MAQASPHEVRSFLTWVWGGLLVLSGGGYLAFIMGLIPYDGPISPVAAGAIAAISLPFWGRWIARPREGWALGTAWTFLSLGSLVAGLHFLPGRESLVLFVGALEIALPFVVAYLANRRRWWLLIPGYTVIALGGVILLSGFRAPLETLTGFALLTAALPLLVIYWTDRRRRWALFLAGMLGIVGVVGLVFYSLTQPGNPLLMLVLNGTLAVVFLAAGLTVRRLDWAIWLAAAFAGAGALSIWYASMANWALLGLALGGYILYRQIRRPAQRLEDANARASKPSPLDPTAPPILPAASDTQLSATTLSGPPTGVEFRPLDPFKNRDPVDEQ